MANSGTGTAANMGHMRTAIGAVNRLRGSGGWSKSYWATRDPIERAAMDQANQKIKQAQEDIGVDSETLRNTYTDEYAEEQYADAFHDVAQEQILGPRKKVDSRTAAIRQQPELGRYSPSANPGRVM